MYSLNNDVLVWLGAVLQSKDESTLITLNPTNPTKTTNTPKQQIHNMIFFHAIKREGKLSLRGFGKFEVIKRREMRGRNPQTGEVIVIPASCALKFTQAKALHQFIICEKETLSISLPKILQDELGALGNKNALLCKNMFMDVAEKLRNEEKATIKNFGTFQIKKRRERVGRNPQTGETIRIKARTMVTFKSSSYVKENLTT